MCPRKLFIMNVEQFIADSIEPGVEVMLTVDVNDRMVTGKLARQLWNLGLVEAYCNKFKSTGPTSYFRGRHQIDGECYTHNIIPTSVSACNFHFGVGDHLPSAKCSRILR